MAMMSAKSVRLWVGAVVIVSVAVLCMVTISRSSEGTKRASAVDSSSAIEAAQREAARLGYPVDEMDVDCRKVAGHYVVVLFPTADRLGGDLTVRVNASDGTVLEVVRGQ